MTSFAGAHEDGLVVVNLEGSQFYRGSSVMVIELDHVLNIISGDGNSTAAHKICSSFLKQVFYKLVRSTEIVTRSRHFGGREILFQY